MGDCKQPKLPEKASIESMSFIKGLTDFEKLFRKPVCDQWSLGIQKNSRRQPSEGSVLDKLYNQNGKCLKTD